MNKNKRFRCTHLFHVVAGVALLGAVACGDNVDIEPTPAVTVAETTVQQNNPIEIETAWQAQCSDQDETYSCLPQSYAVAVRCDDGSCETSANVVGEAVIVVMATRAGPLALTATLTNLETEDVFETRLVVDVVLDLDLDRNGGGDGGEAIEERPSGGVPSAPRPDGELGLDGPSSINAESGDQLAPRPGDELAPVRPSESARDPLTVPDTAL